MAFDFDKAISNAEAGVRRQRVLEVAQLAATIYAGTGETTNHPTLVRWSVETARALIAEAERTEP